MAPIENLRKPEVALIFFLRLGYDSLENRCYRPTETRNLIRNLISG